jgi:nitrogen fixation NifU-like protein
MREFLSMIGEGASGDVEAEGAECCGGGACQLEQSEQKPRLMGRMENPTASAIITGHCGETMEMYLRIEGEYIEDVRFYSDGCASSVACGFAAAELAKGKNIDDAALIEGDTILMVLKELKPEDTHCAFLAAEALQTAIHHWMLQ